MLRGKRKKTTSFFFCVKLFLFKTKIVNNTIKKNQQPQSSFLPPIFKTKIIFFHFWSLQIRILLDSLFFLLKKLSLYRKHCGELKKSFFFLLISIWNNFFPSLPSLKNRK